jgi:hypothetical protein
MSKSSGSVGNAAAMLLYLTQKFFLAHKSDHPPVWATTIGILINIPSVRCVCRFRVDPVALRAHQVSRTVRPFGSVSMNYVKHAR